MVEAVMFIRVTATNAKQLKRFKERVRYLTAVCRQDAEALHHCKLTVDIGELRPVGMTRLEKRR